MNDAELSLRVQKNWIRIKHETQNIREKVMDKLLEDGAISVEEMKEIKLKPKEDQFDVLLCRIIESQKCKVLLHVLETYGRRPLCMAIRKTELGPEDFNTSTQAKLHEIRHNSEDLKLQHQHTDEEDLKEFDLELGETVTNMTKHINEMEQRVERIDTKMDKMVVKKKEVKKKTSKTANNQKGETQKTRDENERLKTLIKVKSDDVVKLNAQLQAKSEQIKWLKMQMDDTESSKTKLTESLKLSNDEMANIQKRLYDSKKEQLDISNQLLASEKKTKEIREELLTYRNENSDHTVQNDQEGAKTSLDSARKPKRVTFKPDSPVKRQPYVDPVIQELQSDLDNALEEKDCVNRLLKLKNAETLKLTAFLRAKADDNDRLNRQTGDSRCPHYEINDTMQFNDTNVYQTQGRLAGNMKEMEELTDKLKPISRKINEITERIRQIEKH